MLNRLVSIIYILLNKGTVTAGELAERFEVSVRTIYRDIEQLSMAGIPVYARKGKGGGISLTDNFVLDRMVISEEEQQRILAALASLRETGACEEEEILQKLGTFFRTDVPDWVAIDFSDWSGRRKDLYEQFRQAILGRRVIAFDYYGQYGEMSRRTVEPIQLLFKEYTWYLRAYCRKREAMRLFKIRRMKRVEILEETFEAGHPTKTDLACYGDKSGRCEKGERSLFQTDLACHREMSDAAVNEQEAVKPEKIVFRIDKKEAYRIYDRFEEEEITVLPEGDFLITMDCLLDDWVYGFILSFGPSAKVISPEAVKEKMAEKIQEMYRNYR
ncbi:MAG: YafY family transcriptional regulator [Roseburia sp.]|nr:YafY family transcriptional regulator [Roseburia sp.]